MNTKGTHKKIIAIVCIATTCTIAGAVDIPFALENSDGGQMISIPFNANGTLESATVDLHYEWIGFGTWVGDIVIALVAPGGDAVEWGGFNLDFGLPSAGDFPPPWNQTNAGHYIYSFDLSSFNVSGDGMWEMRVMNGDSNSNNVSWVGVVTAEIQCAGCPEFDCNENGVEDADDITNMTSPDCDTNGVPDECDPDCDADGQPDACETDTDGDGTPDNCEGIPDGDVEFDFFGPGGDFIQVPFEWHGEVNEVLVEIDFTNPSGETWPRDLLLAIVQPNGFGFEWGDASGTFGFFDAGGYNSAWVYEEEGFYSQEFDFSSLRARGNGTWTLLVGNGWQSSPPAGWAGFVRVGECEACVDDCNNNGVQDAADIVNSSSDDCNDNFRPDECDIADGGDTNDDNALDICQLTCGVEHPVSVSGSSGTVQTFMIQHDDSEPVAGFSYSAVFDGTSGSNSWASDVLIGVTDPMGRSVQFGGFNMTFGFDSIGDFPSDWQSEADGPYSEAFFDANGTGLGGAGTWTVQIRNGWFMAPTASWNGDFRICGIEEVKQGIPTVSEWGLVIMTKLILIAGTLVFRQRRQDLGARLTRL